MGIFFSVIVLFTLEAIEGYQFGHPVCFSCLVVLVGDGDDGNEHTEEQKRKRKVIFELNGKSIIKKFP